MRLRLKAHVVHYTRGRLRIKVPGARGDVALLEALRERLLATSGLFDVRCNPVTGSLLIHHDVGVDPLAAVGEIQEIALCATPNAAAASTGEESGGRGVDLVVMAAKVLPLAFCGHAAGPLVDILAEPVLRAAIAAVEPRWDHTWAVVEEPEDRALALAA